VVTDPQLLEPTDKGIYCPYGDFYIDPIRGVDRAIITHAHSDHARRGSKYYIPHKNSVPILKHRLGPKINIRGVEYGEVFSQNGVKVSLHPAGHIIGSAQVRVEHRGEVWVVSGDYKIENDEISGEFEPLKCHVFITESTFGQPFYVWKKQEENFREINSWWRRNQEAGKISVLGCYVLGKAQRVVQSIDRGIGEIYVHPQIDEICRIFRNHGIGLRKVRGTDGNGADRGAMIVMPSSGLRNGWLRAVLGTRRYEFAEVSGWMMGKTHPAPPSASYPSLEGTLAQPSLIPPLLRGNRRGTGFALSDHADWVGLNYAVRETGAEKVFVTHGFAATFVKWLRRNGIDAEVWGKKKPKGQMELF
jgi:putative mRNA 3-end processing factor